MCFVGAQGAVVGSPLQPFEAHIQYTMQFMIDHNLHGMNFIKVTNVGIKRKRRKKKRGWTSGESNEEIHNRSDDLKSFALCCFFKPA